MTEFPLRPRLIRAVLPFLASTLVLAGSANAQDVFGMLEAHGAMSAQAQYAASLHASYSDRDDDDDRSSRSPPAPTLTREQLARFEAEAAAERAERDARYERWFNGYWDFFQGRDPAEPGEFCTAMYQNPQGIIALSGFDKSWDGGLLMFTGEDIPKPRRLREITVTLTQTGEAPARVKVYNSARDPGMGDFGTLIFAVPTMEAALAGMTEEQEFAISIDGREVFRMGWKGGLQARDELRTCHGNR